MIALLDSDWVSLTFQSLLLRFTWFQGISGRRVTFLSFMKFVGYMQSLRIQSSTPGKIARPLDKLIGPELRLREDKVIFLDIPYDVIVHFELN